MKVYLLNPPFDGLKIERDMRWSDTGRGGTLYYPIWLAYTTGLLEQAGFDCRLVDCAANLCSIDLVMQDIKHYDPGFVVVDSCFPSLENDIKIARLIKTNNPSVKVIMVGAPASKLAEHMLLGCDFVARREFDFVVRDLLVAIRTGKDHRDVPGISYKNEHGWITHNVGRSFSTGEELDRAPFASEVYKKHLRSTDYMLNYSHSLFPNVQILTGRGCIQHCTYCSWPQTLTGRKYRARSVANVLDEFQWIQENMPEIKQVFIEDDTFTTDLDRVNDFCCLYMLRKIKLPWGAQVRATTPLSILSRMKSANCSMVDVGFESGNNDILLNIKKGITTDTIRQFAKDARAVGMSVHGNWIIGLPGETRQTIENTKKLIKEVKSDAITVAVATPFPGTQMWDYFKQNNMLRTENLNELLDEKGHQQSIVTYPELSSEDIREQVDVILKEYYMSWSYVPIALRRVFNRNGWNELRVLMRSVKAFLRYLRGD